MRDSKATKMIIGGRPFRLFRFVSAKLCCRPYLEAWKESSLNGLGYHAQTIVTLQSSLLATVVICQARKSNPNPNFLVRISSGRVGVFHVKGWGPKSSVCPSKPRETKLFFGGYPGTFAGISRGCPKSLRKKSLCLTLVP